MIRAVMTGLGAGAVIGAVAGAGAAGAGAVMSIRRPNRWAPRKITSASATSSGWFFICQGSVVGLY